MLSRLFSCDLRISSWVTWASIVLSRFEPLFWIISSADGFFSSMVGFLEMPIYGLWFPTFMGELCFDFDPRSSVKIASPESYMSAFLAPFLSGSRSGTTLRFSWSKSECHLLKTTRVSYLIMFMSFSYTVRWTSSPIGAYYRQNLRKSDLWIR